MGHLYFLLFSNFLFVPPKLYNCCGRDGGGILFSDPWRQCPSDISAKVRNFPSMSVFVGNCLNLEPIRSYFIKKDQVLGPRMEPLSIATPNYLDRLRTEMCPTVKKKYPCHNSLYLTPAWCRLNIEKKHVWRRRRRRRWRTSCIMRSSPLFSHRQEYALGRESASPVSRGGVQFRKNNWSSIALQLRGRWW